MRYPKMVLSMGGVVQAKVRVLPRFPLPELHLRQNFLLSLGFSEKRPFSTMNLY
jgi:hypothetical protein